MIEFSDQELFAIYELGKMYYEMGYFAPAERIFSGLVEVDGGITPARIGLGLVKLESGLYNESATFFRAELQDGSHSIEAKIGLSAAFVATNEISRARSILGQIEKDLREAPSAISPEVGKLWEALVIRCRS